MTLIDQYYPFDTGTGATATPTRWRAMSRLFYGSGVVPSFLNQLNCTLAGSVVTVNTGACWIDGFYGENDAAKTISVSGNGMIVARMDPNARQITFVYVPNQTVPTQSLSGIYEIPLMQVTGATGRDIRLFSTPIVAGPVHARACRVAAYGTLASWNVFGFDTVSFGSGFAGGVYTCPINADYIVAAQVGFNTGAANQFYNAQLVRNGNISVVWTGTPASSLGNQILVCQINEIVPCSAGDTLSIQHLCSTAGLSGIVGSNNAYMTVRALV